ncbi:hypothetical protein J6590_024950 [Homalodisca vitripennis]|nr:hypothetical protein J6590_024950 [Homalodisca vitripennis]
MFTLNTTSNHKLERAFRLQKRSVRVILGLRARNAFLSCRHAFRELDLLTLPYLYIFEVILYSRSKFAFVRGGNVHHHKTRGRNKFLVQQHRTGAFRKLPSQVGVRLINKGCQTEKRKRSGKKTRTLPIEVNPPATIIGFGSGPSVFLHPPLVHRRCQRQNNGRNKLWGGVATDNVYSWLPERESFTTLSFIAAFAQYSTSQ